MSAMEIGGWRAKIDAIDTTLLHLLNVRAGFALEVGRLKGASGQALRVPAREQEILARMTSLNPGPLDTSAVQKIYQVILDESIRIQVQHGLGRAEIASAAKLAPAHGPTPARPLAAAPKIPQGKGRMNSRKRTNKAVAE
jgi:chorismate mutase-like protein